MSEGDRRRRLAQLFEEHAAGVRAYALRRIDPVSAEDTVSEVFVVACRRIEEVPADPLPWLLACARRVLANQYRGTRRQLALVDRLAIASEHGGSSAVPEGDGPLLRALASLSGRDREVLMLVAWEGLEPARAAAALECSRATLAVRLHRAKQRLAAALADERSSIRSTEVEAVP